MHAAASATAAPRAAAACAPRCARAAATLGSRCSAAATPLRLAAAARRRCGAQRMRAAADGAPPPPPQQPQEPLRDPLGAAKFDATAAMVDDIARLRAKRAAEKAAEAAAGTAAPEEAPPPEWLTALNSFLVFDFFFVLAAGAFLVAGVVEQVSTKSESTVLADLFFKAWPVLVQPALGVLMLASIVSGAAGWARDKGLLK